MMLMGCVLTFAFKFAIGEDRYLYFTVNQLVFGALSYPGTDRRVKPWALMRVPLPDNGTKVILR